MSVTWLKAQRPLAGFALTYTVWLNTLNGLLAIAQAWCLAVILNAVIFDAADRTAVLPWLWGLLGLLPVRAVVLWGAEQTAFAAAAAVRITLRDRVYRHLQLLGPAYLATERSGALVEILTKGIDDLEGYYARFLPAMSLAMILPLVLLIVVLPLDWLAGVVLLMTAPLIPLFMILIGSGAEVRNQRQWKQLARMSAHFLDVIQGLTTLKLFGASRREVEIIGTISDDYRVSTMQVLRIAFLSSAVLEFFASIGIAIVAVFIGFRLYGLALPVPPWFVVPEIDFLRGLFVLMLVPEFYAPLRNLGAQYHARMAATAAAEQLIRLLDAKPNHAVLANEQRTTVIHFAAEEMTRPSIAVRFEAVEFYYEEGRPALCGVTADIPAGRRIAVVGTSGAGKTTFINLLLGFLTPTSGRILINDQDLAQLDLTTWRQHLAWVPQQPRLFQGSIADNLRLGAPTATLDMLCDAARQARIDAFIATLPMGYDSIIGERGAGLSGGQIQRLALARAFLRDAPFVILDEATANLDPDSERLVQESIDLLAQGRMLLVVAHRLATVRKADQILVLEQGRIIEQGDHATLAAAGGRYAQMIAADQGGIKRGE
ncbi:thiol reductant ABC exporter subunit CydD [Chromatium okenii]|uniref:thiol reductant ABC exporter subunit CydD n=1 Tax=Chromatium okenii TaxID=61644 RepID=UPI00190820E9|nr:thiol reductant ABC exporter subunit CydD [Chromatium okenii]MBK1641106.1 thiol reductant ABC exporter subunit CydD [Chromatium okenii]